MYQNINPFSNSFISQISGKLENCDIGVLSHRIRSATLSVVGFRKYT